MNIAELLLLAIGLAMDAFAVAICKGLSRRRADPAGMAVVGLYFGAFQAIMPLLGYIGGIRFAKYIVNYDHWIAFLLLCFIGVGMIKESREDVQPDISNSALSPLIMLPLALATSIDALAVGVSFAFLGVDIMFAISIIGVTTFLLSAAGVALGSLFGTKLKGKAELFGGLVLISIGLKILLSHIGFLA